MSVLARRWRGGLVGGPAAEPVPSVSQAYPFAATALILLLVRAAVIDGRETLFSRSRFDGERVMGATQSLDINFDDQLVLVGLDTPGLAMAADAEMPVTLYWRARRRA